jgi:HSP20 family protein
MARRRQVEWFWRIGSELRSPAAEELLESVTPRVARRFWEPRVDVLETEESILVIAEIAGLDPEEISLTFAPDRHSLVLRGARTEQQIEGMRRVRCYQLEIYYGDFLREVPLPDMPLDIENIKAACRSGFLIVTVPKLEEKSEPRTIQVEEG